MCARPVAQVEGLTKEYFLAQKPVPVLRGVDLTVQLGDFIAIMGASGSGKSTLLHILGCLDRPGSGSYILDGMTVSRLTDRQLSAFRNSYIGFVFQEFNLLPQATVYENVALPFLYSTVDPERVRPLVRQAVEEVGLAHRLDHQPAALSGGERQRVAIARALVVNPKLILADEPTGNLDGETSREILALFTRLHNRGATIVLVTHDEEVAGSAGRVLTMADGRLSEQA